MLFDKIMYKIFVGVEGSILGIMFYYFGWKAVLLSTFLSVIVSVKIWIKDTYLKKG